MGSGRNEAPFGSIHPLRSVMVDSELTPVPGLVEKRRGQSSLPDQKRSLAGVQDRSHYRKMLIFAATKIGDGSTQGPLGSAEISLRGTADLGQSIENAAATDAAIRTDGRSGSASALADRHDVHIVWDTLHSSHFSLDPPDLLHPPLPGDDAKDRSRAPTEALVRPP